MSKLTISGIEKLGPYCPPFKRPLDARLLVTEYNHLTDLVSDYGAYPGMIVYVNSTDDKKGLYVYNGESWKPVATSTTTGDIEIPEVDLSGYLPISGGNVNGSLSAYNFSTDGTVSANAVSAFMFKSDNTEAALQVGNSNEVSFGSNGDTIYLGYENRLNASGAVSKYNFGCSNGQDGAMGGTIYCGEVYVNNGTNKVITQADLESEVLTITNNNPTLSWDSTSTIGTIGGVSLTVTMPSNPNTDTDTKVKQTSLSSGTTDYYLLASSTSSPTSGTAYEAKYNTSVKLNGNGQLTAASFYATSDKRKKENIKEFIPQKSILDLPVVEFDFKDSGVHQIGCIAQDLQEICPEIVNADSDGYLSINESKIVYLLLEELKKLKKEIDEIKGK